MEMSKKERIKRSLLIIVIMVIAITSIISSRERRARKNKEKEKIVEKVGDYNIDLIKITNAESDNTNYLISPYNIEIALNMLREGANGNTKDEIDKVIGNRKINDVSIKNKLNIANGVFIKNKYEKDIKKDFTNVLKKNYQAEILYDEYKTPTVINKWVKEKTNDMIDSILDDIDENFVLGLASALALDIKWSSEFECDSTKKDEFTKVDNSKIDVEMMHQTYEYEAKYFEDDNSKGIILPYQKEIDNNNELEFVGILPNNDVDDYINSLTSDKLKNISGIKNASSDLHINLSLPRFTYEYEVRDLKNVLQKMGINDAFDGEKADFSKIIETEKLFVSTAIHKTKIELNETGTKAAAVTFFGLDAMGILPHDYEVIDIKFNKPFVYMIREKNTGEILFFGVVFEPNKWNGTTCSNN